MSFRQGAMGAALACLLPTLAAAQAQPAAAPARTDSLRFEANLGYVNTAGNSESSTLSIGEKIRYASPRVELAQLFRVVRGRADGELNADLWVASLRGDYRLSQRLAVYGLVAFDRNTLAGISSRFEEGVGLAWHAIRAPRDLLDLEAGVSLLQQRATDDRQDDFAAGRLGARYRHTFRPKTYFELGTEVLPNFKTSDDLRVNAEAALVANVTGALGIRVAYQLRFDNLPEPGFEETDRILTVGVQLNF